MKWFSAPVIWTVLALPQTSAAQNPPIPVRSLLGQPFEVLDQILGKPSRTGMNSMNKPVREYEPTHATIVRVRAEWVREDLVPGILTVMFRKGAVRTWKEALNALGVAVLPGVELSKKGKQESGGDMIVGIANLGASLFWAPSPSGSTLTFHLARATLDAGNQRYIRMKQEGRIAPPEPTKPSVGQEPVRAAAPVPVPPTLTREGASRTILPSEPSLVVGEGYESGATWKVGERERGRLIWHLWPYSAQGKDFDIALKLKTPGGMQIRGSLFNLDFGPDGILRFLDPPSEEESGQKALLGNPLWLQVSRRGRDLFVLANGSMVLKGKVPTSNAGFFPEEMSLETAAGQLTEVYEIRWRTPGYKADLPERAARTHPAFRNLRDGMTVAQVTRIMGVTANYDEAGTFPNGRWLVMKWRVPRLGVWRAGFMNGKLYGGKFLFDQKLSTDEMIRALGLQIASWNPVDRSIGRGWESSFGRTGLTRDGAKVIDPGNGRLLQIEWRDETKVMGKR